MNSVFFLLIQPIVNYLDVILLVTVFFTGWIGFKIGFIRLIFLLTKWAGAFLLAFFLYPDVAPILSANFIIPDQWQLAASFFLVFLVGFLVLSLGIYLINKVVHPALHNSPINRFAGIIPGIAIGLLSALFIVKATAASLWHEAASEAKLGIITQPLNNSADWAISKISNVFDIPTQPKISGAFGEDASVHLSEEFKSNNFISRADLEQQLFQLVNKERVAVGLAKVVADDALHIVALKHAEDMFTRGYFSHDTPEGIDPFERMNKLHIRFKTAGENLAHSNTLLSAHTGLMKSPGHRANILNTHFSRLGIAVLDGGTKGLMIVQEFRN